MYCLHRILKALCHNLSRGRLIHVSTRKNPRLSGARFPMRLKHIYVNMEALCPPLCTTARITDVCRGYKNDVAVGTSCVRRADFTTNDMQMRTHGKRTLARLTMKTSVVPSVQAAPTLSTPEQSQIEPRCLPYDSFTEAVK